MENIQSKIDELVDRLNDWKNNLDLTNNAMSDIEKQLQELKQEVVSRNNQQPTINSVEDAFDLLKPEWYIDDGGFIGQYEFDEDTKFEWWECNMTSEKRAKQIKALIQLYLIAEAMNMGAEPIDFYRYSIIDNGIVSQSHFNSSNVKIYPSFNTRELAEEALEKFKDLFKDLYMID